MRVWPLTAPLGLRKWAQGNRVRYLSVIARVFDRALTTLHLPLGAQLLLLLFS